jgi:hypothetical protein
MSDIQTAIADAQKAAETAATVAPQIRTMADVGLDAASLASANVAKVENLKDPEAAAQQIANVKDDLDTALAAIAKIPELEAAIAKIQTATPDSLQAAFNGLNQTVAGILSDHQRFSQMMVSRMEQLESAVPVAEKIISDFEADLPENWKARLTSFLAVAARHFNI